jgi:hypothetical protein
LSEKINLYSGDETSQSNAKNEVQYGNFTQQASEVREVSSITEEQVAALKREHEEEVERYKRYMDDAMDQIEKLEKSLQEVRLEHSQEIEGLRKKLDFTQHISKEGDLDTKRTYEIRYKTAALLKQIKKSLYIYNSEITMNGLVDEAIQIYCKLLIKQLHEH